MVVLLMRKKKGKRTSKYRQNCFLKAVNAFLGLGLTVGVPKLSQCRPTPKLLDEFHCHCLFQTLPYHLPYA